MTRTIVLSDCHGQPHLLTNAIEHAELSGDIDRFIFAGDVVDIGWKEEECLDILKEYKFEILWGNHDAAMSLGERISPQNWHNNDVFDKMWRMSKNFKIATNVGNTLITHAGYSSRMHREMLIHISGSSCLSYIRAIITELNKIPIREIYYLDYGPLWYRPLSDNLPYSGFNQIFGHTPPKALSMKVDPTNFVTVDPYDPVGWDQFRFRYAEIIDNYITLHDSNQLTNQK